MQIHDSLLPLLDLILDDHTEKIYRDAESYSPFSFAMGY